MTTKNAVSQRMTLQSCCTGGRIFDAIDHFDISSCLKIALPCTMVVSTIHRLQTMPSVSHESLVYLFRECPALAPELLRRVADITDPDHSPEEITARITSAEFTDLAPAEYRADVVVRLDNADDQAAEAIIVEVQRDRDRQKRMTWPHYMTGIHIRLRCLCTLLVIAIDDSVAAWCARPIPLDRHGSVICPVVIGPHNIPRITDFEQASQFPELAVLSAATRGNKDDAADLALAALSACHTLDAPHSKRYHDFIMTSLGEAARRALEKLMSQHKYEYQSDFAKKYVAEGERAVISRLLVQRFGPLSAADRDRIEKADLPTLTRWTKCLLTAETLDDVLSS